MSEQTVAYSYVRWSHPSQAEGDSLRRQLEGTRAYCSRRGWFLDESLAPDKGLSAFRGKNALVGALAAFLGAIQGGRVKPGNVLIVENLDRITRQGIDEGYEIIKRILKSGVRLVTLSPEREYDVSAVRSLTQGALEIQIMLERAADESRQKSVRVKAAWDAARGRARTRQTVLCNRLPAWCKLDQGRIVLDEPKAEIVRRIYALALQGYGSGRITATLNAELVPGIGKRAMWSRTTVTTYLGDRRVLGECQPMSGYPRKPDGPPIPNYFPRLVSDEEFYAVQGYREANKRGGKGRPGAEGRENLFRGIVHEATTGSPMMSHGCTCQGAGRKRYQYLVSTAAMARLVGKPTTYPYDVFEEQLLSRLTEVRPCDLTDDQPGESVLRTLEGQLADLRARLAALEEECATGDVAAAVRAMRVLEQREADVAERLERARREASNPVSHCWTELLQTVANMASSSEREKVRLRIRSLLARAIKYIWVVIEGTKTHRYAAVQVFFQTGKRRLYLLYHRSGGCRFGVPFEAVSSAVSWPEDDQGEGIDLRNRDHADRLASRLREMLDQ